MERPNIERYRRKENETKSLFGCKVLSVEMGDAQASKETHTDVQRDPYK
jgi:hypothetical protein